MVQATTRYPITLAVPCLTTASPIIPCSISSNSARPKRLIWRKLSREYSATRFPLRMEIPTETCPEKTDRRIHFPHSKTRSSTMPTCWSSQSITRSQESVLEVPLISTCFLEAVLEPVPKLFLPLQEPSTMAAAHLVTQNWTRVRTIFRLGLKARRLWIRWLVR